ncbi:hypothetical protein ACQKK5_14525 [Brevibacillus panacihumi]|uniref:hypothetical protein n=1 Tax=Brevibacillus panacihumi TaxID=497735 RepID=UPI003CFBDFC8
MFLDCRKFLAPIVLSVSLLTVPSLVLAEKSGSSIEQRSEKLDKLEKKLEFLREQIRETKDIDKALEIVTKKYSELKVVDSTDENKHTLSSNPDALTMRDRLVYDDEIEEYVFVAYWEWDPEEFVGDEPFDFVGVYTDDEDVMPINPDGVTLQGWNHLGDEEAFFDTRTEKKRGRVALAGRAKDTGVGFWINDYYVTEGSITAILDDVSTSSRKRVYLQYDHSWTSSGITGIAGNVSRGSAGFDVSWESKVRYLDPIYSVGEYWRD